ncbi:MAG: hypothetical protein KAS32_17850 [Candidatus Peribacteraceae bacterium]|nr:hypothetical protein [Candidatus Peribacteraceae bacterium]
MKTETDKIMLNQYLIRYYARKIGLTSDTQIAIKLKNCSHRKTLERCFRIGFSEERAQELASLLQTNVRSLKGK